MFKDHSVTVVIPAYNEEETIADVVTDFRSEECVDRVLVVDNNCRDATAVRARAAGAEVIEEAAPGYGCALRAGLDHAVAEGTDLIVLTEADGSFLSADIWKLLKYSAQQTRKRSSLSCPDCGMTLEEFRKKGRLGCAKDYEVFSSHIDELLERVHGAKLHVGRRPGISEDELNRMQHVTDLQHKLEIAIREEAYESAARIRDELKDLEGEGGELADPAGAANPTGSGDPASSSGQPGQP